MADADFKQTVDTVSEPDVSDFYKLWAAVSAVDTLCVLKGKAGMAIGNGRFSRFLTLFFLPFPPLFVLGPCYCLLWVYRELRTCC